jgi:PAS domain S-box-containing protein
MYRILPVGLAVIIPGLGYALQGISPHSTDPMWIRWLLAGWFLLLWSLSFYARSRDTLPRLWAGSVWGVTGWFLGIATVNGFSPAYAVGVLMVLPAAGSVLHLVTDRLASVKWYYGLTSLAVAVAVPLGDMRAWFGVFYIGCAAGLLGILYLTHRSGWQKEQELRRTQQEAEAFFRHARDAVFLVDVDQSRGADCKFTFLQLNSQHEALTGLTTEEVRGMTPRELLGEELGRQVQANYSRCVAAGRTIAYEERLPALADTKTWHTKLSPIIVDGEVVQIIGIARDITERKDREEQMLLLDRMFQHDLRADIATTLNWVELSREGFDAEKVLAKIQTSAHHMLEILNAAGAVQKALRSGEEMELRTVEVSPYVAEAAEVVQRRHPNARITFRDETDAASAVRGNDLLGSIFENLIANGVRHNDQPRPEVEVTVSSGEEVHVIVADNGPGIPPEQREKIFQEGTQSLHSPGMGLGLYLVDRLTTQFGGHVKVTDNQPRGSRFIVDLPTASATELADQSPYEIEVAG